ncbi:TTAGGG repeat binding factor, partial [Coemansia biformis]
VTIFQDPDRSRSGARAPPEASEQLDDQAGETPDGYESSGEASSIDPSFLEERRIAVVLRDALDDVHLETLIENIDAEHIDIGAQRTPQARTPRRMHIRREPADDFRLQFDDAASDVEPEDGGGGGVPERAPIKRRRVRYGQQQQPIHRGRGNELGGNSSEDDFRPMPSGAASDAESGGGREGASEMIRVLLEPKVPDDRRLAHYEQQQQQPVDWERGGKFRGRRGIRAEDPSLLRGADNSRPVEFTPSPRGSPGPGQPEPEDAGQEGTAHAMLGQYAPRPTDRDPTSSPAQPQPQRGSSSPPSGARRPRRNQRWTDDEEECFIRAVFKHGPQWARILECHGREGCDDTVLRKRTRYNLKDKARTIKLRLLREGRPLGPFVNATGHL